MRTEEYTWRCMQINYQLESISIGMSVNLYFFSSILYFILFFILLFFFNCIYITFWLKLGGCRFPPSWQQSKIRIYHHSNIVFFLCICPTFSLLSSSPPLMFFLASPSSFSFLRISSLKLVGYVGRSFRGMAGYLPICQRIKLIFHVFNTCISIIK